jgi:NADH:ubiquinone reductase (H+-translocating)
MAPHIVIAGGGFAGFHTARRLARLLTPEAARITVIGDTNYLLWTPLLPGAAAGALEPRHAVIPLREQLDRAEFRLAQVRAADPDEHTLEVRTADGRDEQLTYDHLVVALGSISKTLPIPGLEDHGLGFKTLAEGVALRDRMLRHLEIAETLADEEARAPYLAFVFVGGGYAGVEGLAELQDLATDLLGQYPRCRAQGTPWLLVEARDRIMTEVHERLARYTRRELERRGIDVRTEVTVEEVEADRVRLSDGETVPARTLVWTAGVQPNPVVERLGLPLEDGRIAVDDHCRVQGRADVWAIGDAAAVPDPANDGAPCPPSAQHAVRQGRTVAQNVAASLGKGEASPFAYRTRGFFVDLGRRRAVAETFGLRWRGLPAWLLTRAYNVASVPGGGRRTRLITDWAAGLAYGRDTIDLGSLGHPPALSDLSFGETAERSPT